MDTPSNINNTSGSGNTSNSTNHSGNNKGGSHRMWTCRKCSYAYNALWVDKCEICMSERTPPSLMQPSLITVTKDGAHPRPDPQFDSLVTVNKYVLTKFIYMHVSF